MGGAPGASNIHAVGPADLSFLHPESRRGWSVLLIAGEGGYVTKDLKAFPDSLSHSGVQRLKTLKPR